MRRTQPKIEPTTNQGFDFPGIYYYHENGEGASEEEYGIATREDDPQWTSFVKSMIQIVINAEALGMRQDDAVRMPLIELYGEDFIYSLQDMVASIGNYAEIYERNMEHYAPRFSKSQRNTLITANDHTSFANWAC